MIIIPRVISVPFSQQYYQWKHTIPKTQATSHRPLLDLHKRLAWVRHPLAPLKNEPQAIQLLFLNQGAQLAACLTRSPSASPHATCLISLYWTFFFVRPFFLRSPFDWLSYKRLIFSV